MEEFYQNTYNGIIYKKMPTHYLQLSPWEQDQDRRLKEIDYSNCKLLAFKNVCMIINKQFDEADEVWEHRGKMYRSSPISTNQDINEKMFLIKSLPSHKVRIKAEELIDEIGDDQEVSIKDDEKEVKMIRHHGKIYYILLVNDNTSSRVKAYNTFGEFCQWVGLKHVKPIYNLTDKRYV